MPSRIRNQSGQWPMHSLLAVFAAITQLGCGDTEPPTAIPLDAVALAISPTGLSLPVGGLERITAQAYDGAGRTIYSSFEWSSSDPAIATVHKSDGTVTAIAVGSTTVTVAVGILRATAVVWVRPLDPPVAITITPASLTLSAGSVERMTALATDSTGKTTATPIEWSSTDPTIATIGKTDGIVTAIAVGITTVTAATGTIRATAAVSVHPDTRVDQWAIGANASTEYNDHGWAATDATGPPDVIGCADDPRAWASLTESGVDWLELTYALPVRPSEIRIHEVWGVGSIVKVEVKYVSGEYQTVYTSQPTNPQICPRILSIPIASVTSKVIAVRVTVDQRVRLDWNEIDAVQLIGYR